MRLRSIGLDWVALDLGHRPGTSDWAEVMVRATREAGLRGRALVVAGADAVPAAEAPAAFGVLADAVVPVVAVGDRPWDPGWLPTVPYLAEAAPLPAEERERLWRSGLGGLVDDDPELLGTLLGLRLTPEAVRRVAAHAHLLADAAEEPLSAGHVRQSARRVSGTGGAGGNVRGPGDGTQPGLGDLILPPSASTALGELVSWARHRDQVGRQGLLGQARPGIAALFAGGPGTGKTLAAHVVADELGVDLFQVDLSAVVDKYIGETEKNLERVFRAAEALNVVLFFDEADALFGSRSEVKDARDRYANQEVSYLLQRMEHFDGITVLATNLRGNLDPAFSRRMHFIIHFPDPDEATRRRLWEQHLAQLDAPRPRRPGRPRPARARPSSPAARSATSSLAAAYARRRGGRQPVGMRHVADGVLREYRKLGKLVPEFGFPTR